MNEAAPHPHARWKFARDVLVLQLKLLLGNLHNFFLIPATLGAAAIDLVFKADREGARFYRVLDWGRRAEEAIDLYGALKDAPGEHELRDDFTVDAVIAKLEGVIQREYEKGGTAATVKNAVDAAIDQLQSKAAEHKDRIKDTASRLGAKLLLPGEGNDKTDLPPGE